MNPLFHFIINTGIGLLAGLNIAEAIIIGVGGIIIDLDHLIYGLFSAKKYSPIAFYKWVMKEFRMKRPHFFIFHTVEFVVLALFIGLLHPILLLLAIGFALHLATDAATYLIKYRSFKPWTRYMSYILFYAK